MAARGQRLGAAAGLTVALAMLSGCTAEEGRTAAAETSQTSPTGQLTPTAPAPSDDATTPGPAPESSVETPQDGGAAEPAAPSSPSAAPPSIVQAARLDDGTVEVTGVVTGVVEEGGTCTAVVTVSGADHRASAPALPDVTTTVCSGLRLTVPAGQATARLEYADPEGGVTVSAPMEVVP